MESIINHRWAILLLTGSCLFILAEGEIKLLCDNTNGNITATGNTKGNKEYKFMSTGCNSKPNALVLKFVSKNKYCERSGWGTSAKSLITVDGKKSFDTCKRQWTNCYVILMNITFDYILRYGCTYAIAVTVNNMPTVTFEYEMHKSYSNFTLFYEYIVEKPETTTTPPTTTAATFETTSFDSDVTTVIEHDVTTVIEHDVTTVIALESKPALCTSPTSTSQTNSREKLLILVLGILLIIMLLILGILAISYHRLRASLKSASSTGLQDTGSTSNSGEVVVNQIYDSVREKKSEGEVVVNELYEMT